MSIKNSISYIFIYTLVVYILPTHADEAVKNNTQFYPKKDEVTRNDWKTPSCVSSPELSDAAERKNALPDQRTEQ